MDPREKRLLKRIEKKAEELVDENYHTEADLYFDLQTYLVEHPDGSRTDLVEWLVKRSFI